MSYKHLSLLILVNLCWGFNFIVGKWGTELFGSLTFSTIRFAVVLVLLCPFLRWIPGQMRSVFLIGVVMGACHYAVMFLSMYLTDNISSVAVAAQLVVPFSTLLAIVFLAERIAGIRAIAITLSFTGVVIIGFEPIGPEHVTALLLSTLGALALAVATIWMRNLKGVAVFNLQAWIALIATVSLTLLALIFERHWIQQLPERSLFDYWTPVYSAIGATILGHGVFYWLLQRFPVNQVAPFVTLSTIFAVFFGMTLLGDAITAKIVVGGLLTLIGVTIIAMRNAGSSQQAKQIQ